MRVRELVTAVLMQSLSPAILLGMSILISRRLGAAEQGAFVSTKALLDLLVAIGCFGFPQSVVLAVNRAKASRWRLYRDAALYVTGLLPLLWLGAWLMRTDPAGTLSQAQAIAFGAGAVVLSVIWRGILLTVHDGWRFHLVTMVPALALALGVGFVVTVVAAPLATSMAWACAVSGVLVLAGSFALVPPRLIRGLGGERPPYRMLVTNGADVFVQALTATLQTWGSYAWLRQYSGSEDVGRFSIVLMGFQLFLLPLQMVAPMVLNRWSRGSDAHALSSGRAAQARAAVLIAALIGLACLAAPWVVPATFGAPFAPAVPALQVALLAVYPAFVSRVAALRLAAVNRFRANSIAAVVRLAVALGLLWPLAWSLPDGSFLLAAALCWLLGEVAAMIATSRALWAFERAGAGEERGQ